MKLYGSYYMLCVLPIWASALVLYMLTQWVLFILRDRCEGLYYNTSYSAVLGDGALMVVVLMAAGILQREGTSLPAWAISGHFHFLSLIAGFILGIFWVMLDQPKQWGDIYHHLGIAPLLTYLGVTLLVPVIILNGRRIEIVATVCLILLWALLVVYDAVTHRLDQRNYRGLGTYLSAQYDLHCFDGCFDNIKDRIFFGSKD